MASRGINQFGTGSSTIRTHQEKRFPGRVVGTHLKNPDLTGMSLRIIDATGAEHVVAVDPAQHEAVKAQGREILERGFAVADRLLEGRDYLVGTFGIADCALFYVEFWADRTGIALPDNCQAHYRRLLQRPAVRQVLQEEGYAAALR